MQTNRPIRLRTYKVSRVRLDEVQLLSKPNLQSLRQKLSMNLSTFQLKPKLCLNPAYDLINTQSTPKSTLRPKLGPSNMAHNAHPQLS